LQRRNKVIGYKRPRTFESDVEGLIGTERYERTTWRNGYRDRILDTRSRDAATAHPEATARELLLDPCLSGYGSMPPRDAAQLAGTVCQAVLHCVT